MFRTNSKRDYWPWHDMFKSFLVYRLVWKENMLFMNTEITHWRFGFVKRLYLFWVQVNWDEEKNCFHTFCKETSEFYSFKNSMFPDASDSTEGSQVVTAGLSLSHIVPTSLSLSHIVPTSLSLSHIVPTSLSWSHIVPTSLSLSLVVPSSLNMFHIVLTSLSWSHIVPTSLSLSLVVIPPANEVQGGI